MEWRTYLSPLTTRTESGEETVLPAIALEAGVLVCELCGDISPFCWGVIADAHTHESLALSYEGVNMDG